MPPFSHIKNDVLCPPHHQCHHISLSLLVSHWMWSQFLTTLNILTSWFIFIINDLCSFEWLNTMRTTKQLATSAVCIARIRIGVHMTMVSKNLILDCWKHLLLTRFLLYTETHTRGARERERNSPMHIIHSLNCIYGVRLWWAVGSFALNKFLILPIIHF